MRLVELVNAIVAVGLDDHALIRVTDDEGKQTVFDVKQIEIFRSEDENLMILDLGDVVEVKLSYDLPPEVEDAD